MEYTKRKHPRLKNYDYSMAGYYFITICTKDKKPTLSKITAPTDIYSPPTIHLTEFGITAEQYIQSISSAYTGVRVDKYVVMPNHVHFILVLTESGSQKSSPSVHTIIHAFKNLTTRATRNKLWQDSYYDHVIRSEASYQEIWKYIDENPQKWLIDKYYCEE